MAAYSAIQWIMSLSSFQSTMSSEIYSMHTIWLEDKEKGGYRQPPRLAPTGPLVWVCAVCLGRSHCFTPWALLELEENTHTINKNKTPTPSYQSFIRNGKMGTTTVGLSFLWENCRLTSKHLCVQAGGPTSPSFPHADTCEYPPWFCKVKDYEFSP